jgi:DNA-directed RNA polymerase subunit RPC12/RpoP
MLLIFGVRAALVLLSTPVYTCERCGRHGQHRVAKRVRRLTLFFIPVLPVGRARYVDTCSQCGREIELSKVEAEKVAT